MFPQNTMQPQMPQGSPEGSQPVSPEQAQELQALADIMHQKLERMKALRFSSDAYLEKFRGQMLSELFKRLQEAGVNLEDPNSVNEFLQKMSDVSPDVGQEFQDLLNLLIGEENPDEAEPQGEEEGQGAMPPMPPQGQMPMAQ